MATCKDCIHYKACVSLLEAQGYTVPGAGKDADKLCDTFADKSRFIELPCKIGETVYHIVKACSGGLYKCPYCGGYGTDRCDKHPCGEYIEELNFNLTMLPWDKKSYFLSREKAEAKLKKMKGK